MKSPEEIKKIQAKVAETTRGIVCLRDTFDENNPVPFFNGVQFMNANSVGSELTSLAWGVTHSLTDARRFHDEMDDISFYKFEKQMDSIGIHWDGTAWKYAAPIINTLNEFENREDKFFLQILYPEMGLSPQQVAELTDYILNWTVSKENRSVILVSNSDTILYRLSRRIAEDGLENQNRYLSEHIRVWFIHTMNNNEVVEEVEINPLFGIVNWPENFYDCVFVDLKEGHAATMKKRKLLKEQEEQNI